MTTPTAADLVFVGLGAMGLPMARNLVGGGAAVVGVEPSPERRAEAAGVGVTAVGSLEEAPYAGHVVVMVADGSQLAAVVDRAVRGDLSGQLWTLMGTFGPEAVAEQANRLAGRGARVVDAPVTGGVAGARSARLVIFCAGAPADVTAAQEHLSLLGTVEPVGHRPGDGQTMKMVNQLLCTVHLAAGAEALALARRLGLDAGRVLGLMTQGAASSWMLADRGPKMLADEPQVASSVDIFVKDSGLVDATARAAGADVPVLEAARQRFVLARERGLGRADDSRVIETYGTP